MTGFRGASAQVALVGVALAVAIGSAHGAEAADDPRARGKQIYLEGTSASGGEITAVVGDEAVRLPASAVPCASCHGPDGLGRPEGGVLPPDIRWSELTKGYGHVHEDGRRHPAFDEASLARLIRAGLDPAENRLDRTMPLYVMSDEDMADLVAYIRHLEADTDPGLSKGLIQVGTLLPLRGPQGELGQVMAQAMHAYFEEVNAEGGVYGRRIELVAVPYGDTPGATLEDLRAAFALEGMFALVGPYTVGLDDAILEIAREEGAPLVGPFTLDPGDAIRDQAAFYLYSGLEEQARTLAIQAREDAAAPEAVVAIAGPEGERLDRLAAAVRDQLKGDASPAPLTLSYPSNGLDAAALADRVKESGADGLLFLGGRADLEALLAALDEREHRPRVYLLASLVSGSLFDLPKAFDQRVFLAYPTLAQDISDKGRAEYQRLAQAHALPPGHVQGQVAALAAAKLLVEGLRRAGRDLDRLALVDGIEALYQFKSGFTPPLTYGPNRRIGARGAYVMAVDLTKKRYQPVGGWHPLP